MREVTTKKPNTDTDRIRNVGNLGVGGEKGEVYLIDGICSSQTATQYKDPIKIIVQKK